jgi:hypothetical protein
MNGLMKRFHLIFGLVALLAFVLTGQYMDKVYHHLRGMADAPRMLFRSRHIYILLSSLLNLSLGTYLKREPPGWRHKLQLAGSTVIFTATCLLVVAFFYEPPHGTLSPLPISRYGLDFILAGTLAHVIAASSDKQY